MDHTVYINLHKS